jgi:predicted transcriptional regulator of viral defense system
MAANEKRILVFLETHPVFTLKELQEYYSPSGGGREVYDLLLHNKRMGRIGVKKSGLYYAIRPGSDAATTQVDPFLIAAKLVEDSVLSFHTALDLLGFSHSIFNSYYYYSSQSHPAKQFGNDHFRCVLQPGILRKKSSALFGTERIERSGVKVVVTGKERTLVDVLERPQFCGGFEEMYRSFEKMPYVQTELIMNYLDLREQKNLFALVGFFLEQHREQFNIEESFLQTLEHNLPVQPLYWDRSRKGGILSKRWNLLVPADVNNSNWEEF